jgi:hypothetical protein
MYANDRLAERLVSVVMRAKASIEGAEGRATEITLLLLLVRFVVVVT